MNRVRWNLDNFSSAWCCFSNMCYMYTCWKPCNTEWSILFNDIMLFHKSVLPSPSSLYIYIFLFVCLFVIIFNFLLCWRYIVSFTEVLMIYEIHQVELNPSIIFLSLYLESFLWAWKTFLNLYHVRNLQPSSSLFLSRIVFILFLLLKIDYPWCIKYFCNVFKYFKVLFYYLLIENYFNK
jgi:hypothetical protein